MCFLRGIETVKKDCEMIEILGLLDNREILSYKEGIRLHIFYIEVATLFFVCLFLTRKHVLWS